MRYSEARQGRIFVVRLEDGDVVHECLEALARAERIRAASITLLGGMDQGSHLVVGPKHPRAASVEPMSRAVSDVREVVGAGTLFPDEQNSPVVHVHMACGRDDHTLTGCARLGVRVWHVMEAIVVELIDTEAVRRLDRATGFQLLWP
ncbi:MAG: DNA-binding protein [Polyangiaceae bacterium]|nr:DNA-binding protein [Polyangiaceae bacterium]